MTTTASSIPTTKMSSKGQVVIPENIRQQLDLEAGSQFVVLGDKDVVILKRISGPALSEFDGLIKQARSQAKASGLKKTDIKDAIAQARNEK
ncbi:MAG: AbrB/MazE/SpoVT family DNA-binding domain-containing protein [Gammaproteobacteria bacterium]|nr:AbrB/MazE/SpoVT family DNA-binding domain-containing protein [Gammaproteobacteria bacterium]